MGPQRCPEVKRNLEDGKDEQAEAPSAVRAEISWNCDKQLEMIENGGWPKEVKSSLRTDNSGT